eukprot:2210162-Rhodomonas_salina.2
MRRCERRAVGRGEGQAEIGFKRGETGTSEAGSRGSRRGLRERRSGPHLAEANKNVGQVDSRRVTEAHPLAGKGPRHRGAGAGNRMGEEWGWRKGSVLSEQGGGSGFGSGWVKVQFMSRPQH